MSLTPSTVPKTCYTYITSLALSDVDVIAIVLVIELEYIRVSLMLYFSISIFLISFIINEFKLLPAFAQRNLSVSVTAVYFGY